MVIQRLDPIREFRKMDEALNQVWRGFDDGRFRYADGEQFEQRRRIPVDVMRANDDIVLQAALPGIPPEDISVTIDQGMLTISAENAAEPNAESDYIIRERRFGKFHRVMQLPKWVDADNAETQYRYGVLTVTLPKLEATKPRRLQINAG